MAAAAVVGVAMTAGPAAGKRWRKWAWQRDQHRRNWNAVEATVEIEGSGEFFYQLKTRSGKWREPERLTGRTRTCITRESCLLLAETEHPTRLTIRNEGKGTVVLRAGWRRRNLGPNSTYELREGFEGASVYMTRAKEGRRAS